MSLLHFEILWSQRNGDGFGDLIGGLVVLLIIGYRVIYAIWGARTSNVVEEQIPLTDEEEQELMAQLEQEWEELQRATVVKKSVETEADHGADHRPAQSVFDRKLAPQEEGVRFEATPGTLSGDHVVASSVEPTVKPVLESLTGIYEDAFTQTEWALEGAGADIFSQLQNTEGVRRAFILAEILRQPF